MLDTPETQSVQLDLNKAFGYAVTVAWEGLMKPAEPCSVRVEYFSAPGTALDRVSVWSVGAGGHQDLVCNYWTLASPAHACGLQFGRKYDSARLGEALTFIMKNQGLFTRAADAGSHGLIQIQTPDADDRTEAAAWLKGLPELDNQAGAGGASQPPSDHGKDEEARPRMDGEGYPHESAATPAIRPGQPTVH